MIDINEYLHIIKEHIYDNYEKLYINTNTFDFKNNFEILRNLNVNELIVDGDNIELVLDYIKSNTKIITHNININKYKLIEENEIYEHKITNNDFIYNDNNNTENVYTIKYKNKLLVIKQLIS